MLMGETAKRRNGETARKPVRHFRDLDVYQNALAAGLRVYELTKRFPIEERYVLVDQARRSSRSVCANIDEAYEKIISQLVKMIDEPDKWLIKNLRPRA